MAAEPGGTIVRIVDHAPGVRALHVRPDEPIAFIPGQFLSCSIPTDDGRSLTRAYSIASNPDDSRTLEILFNRVPGGLASAYLFARDVGDRLRFTGPFGTFTLESQPAAETIFIADGVTIAPIRPMIVRACATGAHPIRLLYGAAPEDPLVYADEFDTLARRHPRFTWESIDTTDLELQVGARYVHADADRTRHVFVCAIGDRLRRLRRLLRDAGYDRRAIRCERW